MPSPFWLLVLNFQVFMDYRRYETTSAPPADLPTDQENQQPSNDGRFNNEEKNYADDDIHLPKFVESETEAEKDVKKTNRFSAGDKKKSKLATIIAVVILLALFGVYFVKKETPLFKKEETATPTTTQVSPTVTDDFATRDDDSDGLTNKQEMSFGTNAKEKDTDFDGMIDGWEIKWKLNPLEYTDALSDSDEDGLTNLEEYRYDTDPTKADTDGDGYKDGKEVQSGYNPKGAGKLTPR